METIVTVPPIKHSAPTPDAPCAHCGLPVGSYPVGNGPYFCCTGCSMVYQALNHAGLDETYYHLKTLIPRSTARQPAQTEADETQVSELDTEAFMEEHTRPVDETTRSVELFLDGVHCAACVWLVERLPFELDGISQARLDLPRARLLLHYTPDRVRLSDVARWLAQFGYMAYPVRQQRTDHRTRAEHALLIKAGICWALAGNIMLFAFALYSGLNTDGDTSLLTGARWASFVLATISVFYGGSEFFKRAWASLRVAWHARQLARLHIDTPISLGILVGFLHSSHATISGVGDIWFDSISVLIAALLTARWLQLRSRRIAGDASDRLLAMIPTMARRVAHSATVASPSYELVRVDTLKPGDLIEVPAGETIPVDGEIVSGITTINKAVLTGESRPEPAGNGAIVEAGSTNLSAPITIRVRATGQDTRVGKLLAWIQSRDAGKTQAVLLADRLGSYFVLSVLVMAAITGISWALIDASQAARHVVALLVISCPCALGMATPLAMSIAAGRAARKGIFIKSDEALQLLTDVDTIVLDKTGTLTTGCMELLDATGDEQVIQWAVQLETMSNHPIAKALLKSQGRCTLDPNTEISEFETIQGKGVRGCIEGKTVAVGQPAWIASWCRVDDAISRALESYAAEGHTPVAVAVDGYLVAGLAVGDKIREEAKDILASLAHSGKDVYILSGDHDSVVEHVAKRLGIPRDHAMGDASPEYKQAFVEMLQKNRKRTVAMVGDGVNDAIALQTAHVGIAIQGGSSPSLVAADVFMTSEGLRPIALTLKGAHQVINVIRRNLGLSLVYNILGASAAMLGFVSPLVAAIAMPVSSLLVVTSSILQHSFLPDKQN